MQETCKVHGAIEYDDSTLRQRNHAAGQVAESPIRIGQRTNHAGRLLLLTGAPGCPTGSTTGLLQWDSLQRSLVHGSGRFLYSPSQNNTSDQAKPQDIRRTKEQLLDS